ncbi:tyrosine-type recombinase/integrase [Thauera sp.]|uniref:tyrosine-type recombinase/integrase n=1 Tax=Thauera sp. TaxID=1905334 RepID=UPI002CE3FEE3|nr:tyrosine-type recombinase/integrase [Thauera sp.]HRP25958.1 tyrosine-type recombinase/integrase [Thauera sp.]
MRMSDAISGFLLFKLAEGLRPATLSLYRHHLNQFAAWADDPPIEGVKPGDLTAFLAWLREDYRPVRTNGDTGPLSSQSVYNAWTALKSFWRWAALAVDMPDPMAGRVPRPKVQNVEQVPFSADEVRRLLDAAQARRRGRATSNAYFIHELRDRAILLMLLDTGIRAGELVALTVGNAHLPSGRIEILDGKGGKSRVVWLGDHSRPALWRYLQERPNVDPGAPLFLSGDGPMTRSWLRKRLVILGERADVPGVYPHKFRHTFAVQYLRNGGDVFTLQALLGHSSLAMVQHYLRLAQADVEHAHRRASPVDNWLK